MAVAVVITGNKFLNALNLNKTHQLSHKKGGKSEFQLLRIPQTLSSTGFIYRLRYVRQPSNRVTLAELTFH